MTFQIRSTGCLLAFFVTVVIILVQVSLVQGDCWTTGCQPRDWAVVGCDHYERTEAERFSCEDDRGVPGFKYTCCAEDNASEDEERVSEEEENLVEWNPTRFDSGIDANGDAYVNEQLFIRDGHDAPKNSSENANATHHNLLF